MRSETNRSEERAARKEAANKNHEMPRESAVQGKMCREKEASRVPRVKRKRFREKEVSRDRMSSTASEQSKGVVR